MSIINKIKHLYYKNPNELFYRILSILLSSILLPNIILLFFTIYMKTNGFFSYDFFIDGIFGMKLFFLFTIGLMALTAIAFAGSIFGIIGQYKDKIKLKDYWFFILINIVMLIATISAIISGKMTFDRFIFIYIISIILVLHFSFIVFFNAKTQFISLLFGFIIIIFILIQLPKETSNLLAHSLKSFGIGGKLNATIYLNQESNKTNGSLIFLSPKFIYLKLDHNQEINIYPINNIKYITIDLPPKN